MNLTDTQGIVALALVVAIVVAIVLLCVGDEPTPPDADHVPPRAPWKPSAERKRRLEQQRAEAIEKMKALKLQTLLEGKPGWACVNPMGKKDEAGELDLVVGEDNVVLIRRAR